ncbi:MAG: LLM class F420-dependent oxidoreductase [Candidatus Binataceae bacterium]
MRIGMNIIGIGAGIDPDSIRTIAENAERLNFATLWSGEHIVFVETFASKYPYTENGALPGPVDSPLLSSYIALTYASAFTQRIRLATGITIVPQYNPLILAKEIMSLDRVSRGRFMLGVGIGWLEEEFQALGISWERRAARTNEYIAAMKVLWKDKQASFSGEFVNFKNVISMPKPTRAIPIAVGGESLPALRRVAKYGNAWYGYSLTPEQLEQKLKKLEQLLAENNRRLDEIEIIVHPPKRPSLDQMKKYSELGVSELVFAPWGPRDAQGNIKRLEELAREFVEPAAKLG